MFNNIVIDMKENMGDMIDETEMTPLPDYRPRYVRPKQRNVAFSLNKIDFRGASLLRWPSIRSNIQNLLKRALVSNSQLASFIKIHMNKLKRR